MKIKISDQFSPVPSGRFYSDGPDSGERFRDDFLFAAIKSGEKIEIDLDDTAGYGSSFLEEAFGGAVRAGYISSEDFLERLILVTKDSDFVLYPELIRKFIADANR